MTALNFPSTPTNGQVYQGYLFDGTKEVWRRVPEQETLSINDLGDVSATSPAEGELLQYNGQEWTSGINIDPTSPIVGQALVYNGTKWVNGESAGGFETNFLLMGA